MKKIIFLLPIALFLVACSGTKQETEMPLAEKRAMLKEKQTALQTLMGEIDQLEKEIIQLDPNSAETRKLVTTFPIERKTFHHYVDIQGTVQSDQLVNVSSETGGRLVEVAVIEGQTVKKGQLIARVDLDQLKKQIAEVETSLELTGEIYARQQRLWDQQIGSEIQLLQAKNNVDRLNKSLETMNSQLQKSDIYAPLSGVVDRVILKAGEISGPGSPIVQILNTKRIKVVADVPETYLRSVRKGEMVTIRFPSLNEEKQARVSLIGGVINPSNRTFQVEVDLNNGNGLLKPNLLAIMLISDFSEKDAIAIPIELVQQEIGGKDFVFIKTDTPDGPVAKKVYVNTGKSYEGKILITEGLTGEEMLINDGARFISDNDLLKIQQG